MANLAPPTTYSPSGRPSYRVVLLGDQGVGKSSISYRFIKNDYIENNPPTIGAAYLTQTMKVGEQTVKLDLWDTAGQERFAALAPMYYRTAEAAVVVYDICNKNSYGKAMEWVSEVKNSAPSNIVIMLCGNKADMAQQSREVRTEAAIADAQEKSLMFAEVSAKTGAGVKEVFEVIAKKLVNKTTNAAQSVSRDNNIKLSPEPEEKKGCPC